MALEKVLSRDFTMYVNTGTEISPTWTKIGGKKDITLAMSEDTIDLSDCDTTGKDERITDRGVSFTVTANRLEDKADGARDPGQAAVEAVMFETGADAILGFKCAFPHSGSGWVFDASVSCTPFGGGLRDGANWSSTLKCVGVPEEEGS